MAASIVGEALAALYAARANKAATQLVQRKRRSQLGKVGLGSQAANVTAYLNDATGQQLVAIARSEGIGAEDIPRGKDRSVIVRNGRIYPSLAPNSAPVQSLVAVHSEAALAAYEAVSVLADRIAAYAGQSPHLPVIQRDSNAGISRSLYPIAALRHIAEQVSNLVAQFPPPPQAEAEKP